MEYWEHCVSVRCRAANTIPLRSQQHVWERQATSAASEAGQNITPCRGWWLVTAVLETAPGQPGCRPAPPAAQRQTFSPLQVSDIERVLSI